MLSVENNALVVTGHKEVLVLHQKEITELLKHDPKLWQTALKRGKYHKRAVANMSRRVPHHATKRGREPTW